MESDPCHKGTYHIGQIDFSLDVLRVIFLRSAVTITICEYLNITGIYLLAAVILATPLCNRYHFYQSVELQHREEQRADSGTALGNVNADNRTLIPYSSPFLSCILSGFREFH